jgi:hypothetical protein
LVVTLGGLSETSSGFASTAVVLAQSFKSELAGLARSASPCVLARACGLDLRIPVIVTSAELGTLSKVAMAEHARDVLGLRPGLSTTVLVDNKQHNVDEFATSGGQTILYERDLAAVRRHLEEFAFHVAGGGEVRRLDPSEETPGHLHQHWVLDREADRWRVDVMADPSGRDDRGPGVLSSAGEIGDSEGDPAAPIGC